MTVYYISNMNNVINLGDLSSRRTMYSPAHNWKKLNTDNNKVLSNETVVPNHSIGQCSVRS